MSAYQLPPWVWPSALGSVCALVAVRGGRDERLAAVAIVADWALGRLLFHDRWEGVQWPVFALDALLLLAYAALALGSRRHWPLVTAAFALLSVVTHMTPLLGVSAWAYLTAELIWSYLILAVIAYGALSRPLPQPATTVPKPDPITAPGATRR